VTEEAKLCLPWAPFATLLLNQMLVHGLLEDSARRAPDVVALIESRRQTTYRSLDRLANQIAHLCHACGVDRGDRVVIALENSLEMVAAYLGAQKAGGVAVPLLPGPRSDRLGAAVRDCLPRMAIVDTATARAFGGRDQLGSIPHVFVAEADGGPELSAGGFGSLSAALEACSPDPRSVPVVDTDLAAIIYTSGSTGSPRGVMLSHRNFVTNATAIVSYLGLSASDRVLCVLPFSYVYGLSLLHTHLLVGGSIVIENRSAFPNVVLRSMAVHEVTGFAGVPSTFALMLHRSSLAEAQLPHLRYVTQAGGAMPPARVMEWIQRGPRADFYVMYGATEAAARLTFLPPADLQRKPGSIGRPIPGVGIRVITEEGRDARPGEVGELVARGSNISAGYWRNEAETHARFSPEGYHTGDLGYADEEGFLYLVGRQHDMIKVGAHRVGAREIEDVLHTHPAVYEAAVVAAPHDLLGEVPVAFVALKTPVADASQELRAHCAACLAAHKVPQTAVVLPELPKLEGRDKVDRASLRALAAGMRFEAVP